VQVGDWVNLALGALTAIAVSWFFYRLRAPHRVSRRAGRKKGDNVSPAPGSRQQRRTHWIVTLAAIGVVAGAFWLSTRWLPHSGNASPPETHSITSSFGDVEGVIAQPIFTDIAGHDAEGELTLMAVMGGFSGDSGFGGAAEPDTPITRAEFCKMTVFAIGKGHTAFGLSGLRPSYSDSASFAWAWGYVNVATQLRIMFGYADGSFRADHPVTYAEAVAMLVRGVVPGHEAQVPSGVWPLNYLYYGIEAGFTGTVDVGLANLPCTRGDLARLLFATMQVQPLDDKGRPDADGAVLPDGVRLFQGVCYDVSASGIWVEGYDIGGVCAKQALGDAVYVVGAESLDELIGAHILVVTAEDGKVVFIQRTED